MVDADADRASRRRCARSATTASTTTATAPSTAPTASASPTADLREVRLPRRPEGGPAAARRLAALGGRADGDGRRRSDATACASAPGGQDGVVDFQVPALADVTMQWAQVGDHDFALYDDEGMLLACDAGRRARCVASDGMATGMHVFSALPPGRYHLVVDADRPRRRRGAAASGGACVAPSESSGLARASGGRAVESCRRACEGRGSSPRPEARSSRPSPRRQASSVAEAAVADRISGVKRKLRILVAKAGLDGHDRGAKVVARALADAGYEVIYSGLHQTPEMIAAAAQQESVDAVGLSMMSGAHMTHFPAVLDGAGGARRAATSSLFGGGIVPDEDAAALKALGVAAIFTPGTSTQADRGLDRARAAAARRRSRGVSRAGAARSLAHRRCVAVAPAARRAANARRRDRGGARRRHPAVGAGQARRRGQPLLREGAGRHAGRGGQDRAGGRRRRRRPRHQGRRRRATASSRRCCSPAWPRAPRPGRWPASIPGSTVIVPLAFEGQTAQFSIKVKDAPDRGPPAPRQQEDGRAGAARRRSPSSCWSTRRRCARRRRR